MPAKMLMCSASVQALRKEAVVASASGKDFFVHYGTDFHELLQELLLIHRHALHHATVIEMYANIMSITSTLCLQRFTDLLMCSADPKEPFQAALWT